MILAHDDQGSGPAVVLLHSGVCDRRMWDSLAAMLEASHRVIRPDLRGFGETPLPPERFSFAEDLITLLDALGLEAATFVGSSLGGRIALEVAVTRPDRVTALLLLCPAFSGLEATPDAEAFDAQEDRLLGLGDVDGAVELNVSTWLGPEASEECRDLVRTMQRRALEVQLAAESVGTGPEPLSVEVDPGRVSVPTLVVSGGRDMDHFQNIARLLAASVPGARLQQLPWAGHLPSLERPDEVNDLVAGFLAETAG